MGDGTVMQEWNEIQFNGVYYHPSKKGKPGELPAADTSYTFRYPRPERSACICITVPCLGCILLHQYRHAEKAFV